MSCRRLPALVSAWLIALAVLWAPSAQAGPRADVQRRLTAAMESYDLLEYEAARKLLLAALELAKEGGLADDPLTARVHLALGIVSFAGLQDKPAAKRSFVEALTIDPKVVLDPAYKTPEMSAMLEGLREKVARSAPPPRDPPRDPPREGAEVDCLTLSGLRHRAIESAPRGSPLRLSAALGGDIEAQRVSVFYRAVRATEFQEVRLTRDRDCVYAGAIPAAAMSGELLYYYIAALGKSGLVVASSGAAGAPHLLELTGAQVAAEPRRPAPDERARPPRGAPDGQNDGQSDGHGEGKPDGQSQGKTEGKTDRRADLSAGAGELRPPPRGEGSLDATVSPSRPRQRSPRFSVALGAASGLGYVTGETEQLRNEVKCCIAPGWFTVLADFGYAISPRWTLGAALRLGFPIGANIDGHSPLGPAGFARARYAFSRSPSTLYVAGQLGAGIIRNTLKLSDTTDPEMDTDVVALGPLLAGGSMGYLAGLGSRLSLRFELTAIMGLPVVSELGTSRLNFGVQMDATVGLGVHF